MRQSEAWRTERGAIGQGRLISRRSASRVACQPKTHQPKIHHPNTHAISFAGSLRRTVHSMWVAGARRRGPPGDHLSLRHALPPARHLRQIAGETDARFADAAPVPLAHVVFAAAPEAEHVAIEPAGGVMGVVDLFLALLEGATLLEIVLARRLFRFLRRQAAPPFDRCSLD
jgi:hypothetical protein